MSILTPIAGKVETYSLQSKFMSNAPVLQTCIRTSHNRVKGKK